MAEVQRHQGKLTKQSIIDHNQKCFKKFSSATKAYFMEVVLAERYNKTTWNNNVFSLQVPLPIQNNTTVALSTILTEPTVPATSYNYVTAELGQSENCVCISSKTGKISLT